MGLFQRMFGGGAGDKAPDAVADLNEAVRLFRKGSFTDALAIADRLIAAAPDVGLSWRFRGECLFSLTRYDEAIAAFDKAAQIGGPGTDDLILWSSLALHNGGKRDEAKARLRDALTSREASGELRSKIQAALQTLEQTP